MCLLTTITLLCNNISKTNVNYNKNKMVAISLFYSWLDMIYSPVAREKCQISQFNNEELRLPFPVNNIGEYKTTFIII